MVQSLNLFKIQKANIERMLNYNTNNKSDNNSWKILIFDQKGKNIISNLYNLAEIRALGITLLLLLDSKKETITDINAIYFVEPNKRNLDNILNDLNDQLYKGYYLNFVSTISKDSLSYLARKSVELGVSDKIKMVFDQFSDFCCYEPNLFSLHCPNSFQKSVKLDSDSIVDSVVDGLFDIFVSMKIIPVIKAVENTIAERIGKLLAERISFHSEGNNGLLSDKKFGFSFNRILLVLVTRQIDITSMLHHTAMYQTLVHDLLNFSNNQVTIENLSDSNCGSSNSVFDLNASDWFWSKNKGLPFIDAAEAVNKMVADYKKTQQNFKNDNKDYSNMMNTISELPEIRTKKKLTDRHTAIAGALSRKLNQRKLAEFFLAEENLMQGKGYSKKNLEKLFSSDGPKLEDKLRLYFIFLATTKSPTEEEMISFEALLLKHITSINSNEGELSNNKKYQIESMERSILATKRLLNIKFSSSKTIPKTNQTIKAANKNPISPSLTSPSNKQNSPSNTFKNFFSPSNFSPSNFLSSNKNATSSFTDSFTSLIRRSGSSLIDKGAQLFSEVKNLLPTSKLLPLTKAVNNAMENKNSFDGATRFVTIDPASTKLTKEFSFANKHRKFGEAVVFVVGGGSLAEFQNLQDLADGRFEEEMAFGEGIAKAERRNILYGATEILKPESFLEDLSKF